MDSVHALERQESEGSQKGLEPVLQDEDDRRRFFSAGVCRVAKLVRTTIQTLRVPKMPPLNHNWQVVETLAKKADLSKQKCFPPLPHAELGNTSGFTYPQTSVCSLIITNEEVEVTIVLRPIRHRA